MSKSSVSGNATSSERVDKAVEAHSKGDKVENVTSYEKKMIEIELEPLIQGKKK